MFKHARFGPLGCSVSQYRKGREGAAGVPGGCKGPGEDVGNGAAARPVVAGKGPGSDVANGGPVGTAEIEGGKEGRGRGGASVIERNAQVERRRPPSRSVRGVVVVTQGER